MSMEPSQPAVQSSASEDNVAVVVVRPRNDISLVECLRVALETAQLPVVSVKAPRDADVVQVVSMAAGGRKLRAIFELGFCTETSMALEEMCESSGLDLYRYQTDVFMFKQMRGSFGPPVIAADMSAVSHERLLEEHGWGLFGSDEEGQGSDFSALSDGEIAQLYNLPNERAATDNEDRLSHISEFGYVIDSNAEMPLPFSLATAPPLTDLARQVLLSKGTEKPYSWKLADGSQFPEKNIAGTFISPLTGAPLFSSADLRFSSTGWPSFTVEDPGLRQHLDTCIDTSDGMLRSECVEKSSRAHLGHDFDGALCINAAALIFVPEGDALPAWLPRPSAPAIAAMLHKHPAYLGKARVATFAAGCFWGIRRVLAAQSGVLVAIAGFTGGSVANVTYEEVCHGKTGHVEAVQVAFLPSSISYSRLLDLYWSLVPDLTRCYQQGQDIGPQYEPVIFYHSEAQRDSALKSKEKLQASVAAQQGSNAKVVTRVSPARVFWAASEEHQQK